jgi:hypothetical protein
MTENYLEDSCQCGSRVWSKHTNHDASVVLLFDRAQSQEEMDIVEEVEGVEEVEEVEVVGVVGVVGVEFEDRCCCIDHSMYH